MNKGRQNTCDKIRGTLRYIFINCHWSKIFHVEAKNSRTKAKNSGKQAKMEKKTRREYIFMHNFDPDFFEDDVVTGDESSLGH